ncbi:MAG: hypothetical protein M1820_001374 [Bogoriella megaspora]|nr:MAG: hypothetical protein M1820_001374 [Bogoriella megaspora]
MGAYGESAMIGRRGEALAKRRATSAKRGRGGGHDDRQRAPRGVVPSLGSDVVSSRVSGTTLFYLAIQRNVEKSALEDVVCLHEALQPASATTNGNGCQVAFAWTSAALFPGVFGDWLALVHLQLTLKQAVQSVGLDMLLDFVSAPFAELVAETVARSAALLLSNTQPFTTISQRDNG